MRKAFVEALVEIAHQDKRVVLLTGDLGFMVLEPFMKAFPDRFLNAGVAEQNMVGMATGLAESGYIPFVYSIVPFSVLRPFEFIRNGPVYHRLPVRIVGVGEGFDYGHNGLTHFGLEDISVMRTQPGITTVVPADCAQALNAIRATYDLAGPVYYRLSKNDKLSVPGLEGSFAVGRVDRVLDGEDILVLSSGGISSEALKSCELLKADGLNPALGIVSTFNPSPTEELADLLASYSLVCTVEEHYVNGGLGSLVAEVIAEKGLPCRLIRCGVGSLPSGITGSREWLLQQYGLDPSSVANRLKKELVHTA
jgi:transketolase